MLLGSMNGTPPPRNSASASTARRLADEVAQRPICVIDDDPWVRDSLTTLLEAYGFKVLTFSSGNEFLANGQADNVGFLIVDQHMPGMDGLTILAAMQAKGSTVPSIVITGRTDPGIEERAAKLGVIAVLEKPFSPARLGELIHIELK
jgi:FixJ family two-component response regulator